MNQKFDPTKPVQTRDGKPARILCTDKFGDQPIVALTKNPDGTETTGEFSVNGSFFCNGISKHDLINVPLKIQRTVFLAVYDDGMVHMFAAKENAMKCLGNHHLFAIKEITFEAAEGEGIDE